ncbi:translation elongation factor Ts [Candidatus Kinetoplastidibacterium crithidiae]|uniref:Elongation factor Ts n=1 Tax=Candidatus Kinetoplastidibacterium crithidiae TCC036E TaxID=1208918 RepID=M1LWK8_9PROT|nr:translation elongation factor Ts [Candidatus Kinetoplastibacterium crithidii]AGF47609.1 elongation factor EF-Ts [Candidatus Kinetoplastibacterium crithidii TCC036E]
MTKINASLVKELREKTDAPMMECKKALIESEGDISRAEEILRVRLGSKASKAASRLASEGLIGIYTCIENDMSIGVLVEVNCETDFVAKNSDFINFVDNIAKIIANKNPENIDALLNLQYNNDTVDVFRSELVGKIGENISIRRFERISSSNKISSYNHNGKIGVLVDFNGDSSIGKDLAMHIAATKPKAIDESGISQEDLAIEKSIAKEKAINSGKPKEIVEKMIEGSIQKFLKEVTLVSQQFIKNDKQTVNQMLKEKNSNINKFIYYAVGEGIEKKDVDFAAEVAAMRSN